MYAGEITADGHYIDHSSSPMFERVLGGSVPDGMLPGALWESRIHPEDMAAYEQFNRRQLNGEDAELTYRLIGLDGVTRILWDRARPQQRADGSVLVRGIISDVTMRQEADARLAEASERFTGLLDVVGEHVYLALARHDGQLRGAVPGTRCGPPAGRSGPRRRDGELGGRRAPRGPDRLRRVPAGVRRRGGGRRGVPADRRRRDHALGPRPRRHPPAARRHDRDQRHRLRRHGAAAHARRARPGTCGAVARGRGDGRPPLHAPGRSRRRPRRRLPRPQPGRAGGWVAPRGPRGRADLGVAPARRTTASAGARPSRASWRGTPIELEYRVRRPRRPRAHRARPPAPAP